MERKKYPKEFKNEAVGLVLKGDRTMTEIAASLGLRVWHLSSWTRDYVKKNGNAFPGNGRRSATDEDNEKLRKENARLQMENEILKKATAIFSRLK